MAEGNILASKRILGRGDTILARGSFLLFFCNACSKKPLKSADKAAVAYKRTPNLASFQSVVPTVLIRKAEEGIEEQANARSHSERSIAFFSYAKIAHLAPTGKPHSSPNTTAQQPARERSSSFPKGFSKGAVSHFPAPLATSNSDSTIKGNSEGTTARAHRASPFLIQSAAISARRSIKARLKKRRSTKQSAPHFGRSAFFARACCGVILLLPVA